MMRRDGMPRARAGGESESRGDDVEHREIRRLPGVLLTAALLAATIVPAARGQADAETDYTEFDLGELVDMDVVYGASRYEQKLSDAPAAVTVITSEEIRGYGYRTLGEVLASVRGFCVTYDRSYEYIGVRGFGRPGDYNTRVLILHDGHAANDLIYGQASASSELAVDLDLVERIEIIRGPGSALYGAGAFFAVINIVTIDGSDLDGAEAMAETGSYGSAGGRAAWGRRLGTDGDLLLSTGGFNAPGGDLYWPEYDDPATNDGLFVDGDGEAAAHVSGRLRRGGLVAAAGYTQRRKHVPTGEWDMLYNDNAAALRDSRFLVDLAFERSLAEALQFRAHLAYDHYRYTGKYPYDYADEGEPLWRVINEDLAEGRWLSGDLQFGCTWRGRHRLVAGGDFRQALEARQKAWDPYAVSLDVDERVHNLGFYTQDEIDLGRNFALYAGLRVDSYSSFGGLTTPRLGLIAHPGAGTTLKLLYGEAFRAPNAYELFYGDGSTQKGNGDLEPEHIRTTELAWEQAIQPGVAGSVSVFHNDIEQLIDQRVDPADGLITFANLGEASTIGAEIELDARLLAGWRGRAGYSFQQTEDERTANSLTNSPEHIVQANLSTPRYAGRLAGGLDLRHVSRRRTLAGASVDPYTVANLTLLVEVGVPGLALDATVYNLFDEAYADPGAEHQSQAALQREGRQFGVRLRYRW